MKHTLFAPQSPVAARNGLLELNISGSDDIYGACSLEHFNSVSGLTYTHDDAQGFLNWLGNWYKGNFWFQDGNVKVWKYEDSFDNWQDTYGMDAVKVFYHSGHGGMGNDGVFGAPLGGVWDSRDWALSNRMVIGNAALRYLFWSTCQSLKVPDLADINPTRVSPMTTWGPGNRGLRMIFGFQSNSIDSPDYGRNFGNNWNAGQTLGDAWINAGWAISHNHLTTVCAMGASSAEAADRVFHERLFFDAPASRNWYHWRWGSFVRPIMGAAVTRNKMPDKPHVLDFGQGPFTEERLTALGGLLGFTRTQAGTLAMARNGSAIMKGKEKQMTLDAEGRLTAVLAPVNHQNKKAIDQSKAIELADKLIAACNFRSEGIELELDSARVGMAQGGTPEGSGQITEAYESDITLVYRQTVKGVRSVNASHGLVAVTVDNDGTITQVHNSTRPVTGVSDRARMQVSDPDGTTKPKALITDELHRNQLFSSQLRQLTNTDIPVSRTSAPLNRLVHSAIGYDFSDAYGKLVDEREYDVQLSKEVAKRYKLRVPIFA